MAEMASTNASQLVELLVSERERLLRYLGRYLDPTSAEDTVQSLYLKVICVPGEPQIRDARQYLYRLARNQAIDRGRHETRHRHLHETAAHLLWEEDIDAAQIALARAELDHVVRAAEALPEPTRGIFRMNRFEGLTQREIATQLGVSSTTVEKHIQRALRTLDHARTRGVVAPATGRPS